MLFACYEEELFKVKFKGLKQLACNEEELFEVKIKDLKNKQQCNLKPFEVTFLLE